MLEKTSVSTPREYSPVSNNNPPLLINFWIFCRIPSLPLLLSYLDPPPRPHLINFPDFVLQIFQSLLKQIILNKEPQKRVSEIEQEEQEDEYINPVDFLHNF